MKIENAEIGMEVQVKDNTNSTAVNVLSGQIRYIESINYLGSAVKLEAIPYEIGVKHLRIVNKKRKCKHGSDCKNYEPVEPVKAWPDSFEEAFKLSTYWGLEIHGGRYLIVSSGMDIGHVISANATKALSIDMIPYWKNNGVYGCSNYKFIRFDTARGLYQWLLDGEE